MTHGGSSHILLWPGGHPITFQKYPSSSTSLWKKSVQSLSWCKFSLLCLYHCPIVAIRKSNFIVIINLSSSSSFGHHRIILYHLCYHRHRVSIITIVSSNRSSCRYDPLQLVQQEVLEIFTQPMPQPQPRTTVVAQNCYNMISSTHGNSKQLM